MTCDTSCCTERAAAVHEKASGTVLSCWALVLDQGGEGDGGGLWVFDATGTRRHFVLPASAQDGDAASSHTLCFASHIANSDEEDDYMNLDSMLTPCFEEGGRHGIPDETCFCGEEEPHVHAHWHNPKTCHKSNNRNKGLLQELPSNLLMFKENTTSATPAVVHEKEDDIPIVAARQGWPCDNTRHFVRPKANLLRWESSECDECPSLNEASSATNSSDRSSTSLPQFRLLGKRVWRDEATHQPITMHIFTHGKEENIQECPCDFFDCPCSSSDVDTVLTGCCPSSQNTPLPKNDENTASSSCCRSSAETEHSCQCQSLPERKTHSSSTTSSSACGCHDKTNTCCSLNPSEHSQEQAASSSSCCRKKTTVVSPQNGDDSCNNKPSIPDCSTEKESVPVDSNQEDRCDSGCCGGRGEPDCRAQEMESLLDGAKRDDECEIGCCAGTELTCCVGQDQCHGKEKHAETESTETFETNRASPCGRSEFFVERICCASEIPVIHSILDKTPGIEKVAVNAITKTVYVDHETRQISANEVAALLNSRDMGAEVRVDATNTWKGHQKSLFVVSKFQLDGSRVSKDRLEIVLKAFDQTKIESFTFDEINGVLTVIHNPATMNTQDVVAAVRAVAGKTDIILDGANQNQSPLDFAALTTSISSSESSPKDGGASATAGSKWPKPNVVISGVLWIVSMLHYIGDNWEPMKYVALGSIAFGLPPIGRKAIGTLRQQLKFDANGLMFMASLGAIGLGEYPEAAAVVFLFSLSEWLETRASSRAHQALSAIANLRPNTARLIDPETQQLWNVPAAVVPVGALVAVKAGDQFPCDGVVVEGETTVDESSLTGESRPVRKVPKDSVAGGTVNSGVHQLVVRVTAATEDSAVSRLIRLVEEAQLNRSETEKAIDNFARIYTPVVLFAAILMCSIPWAFGMDAGKKWTYNGLVLIVLACPCALIISTPVVYVAGLAATAQKGILVKGGVFLEALGQLSHICFDKTGTLTNGEFCLLHLDIIGDQMVRQEVLEYLLLMEDRASHPVAQAIVNAARNESVTIPQSMILEKHVILEGEGVFGVINGQDVHVGNERLFERLGLLPGLSETEIDRVCSWKRLGGTIGFIGISGFGIVGAFCAADAVRKEAANVVANFQKRRIILTMLTGDSEDAAQSVGRQLDWSAGGDQCEIRAKLLPADKLAYVEELTSSYEREHDWLGRKKIVLFCGDGVNDAPALAAAHVGVAMGSGATVAMETAHVTLLDPSLRKLEFVCGMGRQVRTKIAENVTFSIAVKVAFIAWAMTGNPSLWLAIGSDMGSMLLVTLNAMRLLPSKAKGTGSSSISKQIHLGEADHP